MPQSNPAILPWPLLTAMTFLAFCLYASTGLTDDLRSITVAGDFSYAPFEFSETNKAPCRGIFVDLWHRWSEKTGIAVNYRCMQWDDALKAVEEGRADVVGGIFFSPERAQRFDFSKIHMEIPTAIFFHRSIYGLQQLEDLKGFRVGVVKEDFAENFIKQNQPDITVVPYPSNEELVRAAGKDEIRVFVADTPVALFYLIKSDLTNEFNYSQQALYKNKVYSAVKKGNVGLLKTIDEGFDLISKNDINAIEKDWTGLSIVYMLPWTWIGIACVAFVGLCASVLLWNHQLRDRVKKATTSLENHQHKLVEQMHLLAINAEIATVMIKGRNIQTTLQASTEILVRHLEVAFARIWLLNERNHTLELCASAGMYTHLDGAHSRIPMGESKIGRIAADRKAVITNQVIGDPNVEDQVWAGTEKMVSFAGAPLIVSNRLVGVIAFFARAPLSDTAQHALISIADQIALGVNRNRMEAERQQTEIEKNELERQLSRAKKMEALGLLAGGVAHDLNNILSGITSLPELLLMDENLQPKQRLSIETIQKAGQRASAVVDDLLTITRGVAGIKEVLNINRIIREYTFSPEFKILTLAHPALKIETRLDPELMNIKGSYIHIRKALMNLVTNAVEAVAVNENRTQQVWIETSNQYLDRPMQGYDHIHIGEYVVLTVSDTGPGIADQDLERIFEPFFTKKMMGKSGTGLGLVLVWNAVQDHQGYINVKTAPQGSSFQLYFPITRESLTLKEDKKPMTAYMGKGQTVLIVDDEEKQREIGSQILEKLGYSVSAVASGEAAVEFLKNNPVDIIVLDMILGEGMNGRETYAEIIKFYPGQKAVIVSGFTESEEVRRVQQMGAGEFVKKPYSVEKIGLAVYRLWGVTP